MIRADRTMLVLLAAGRSQRFGEVDKLTQPFLGRPLALHVVTALQAVPFLDRVAIISRTDLDFGALGYRVIVNDAPENGMSGSIKLGVAAAQAIGAAAVLIALADMPKVTAMHVFRLLDEGGRADSIVASSDGERPGPPALFAAGRFPELMALEGDEGGRQLIRAGKHVVASPADLVDIDTPEELERLRALV